MFRAFFKHGSNALLAGGVVAIVGAIAARKLRFQPALIASGVAIFAATEYGSHRFLFHATPSKNAIVLGLQRRMHYDHHAEPARLDLLFLPPWYLVPNLALTSAFYAAVTRSRDRTASIVLGNMLALLWYEWVHYVAHVPYRPRTASGRYFKKYHLWHHFKNERLWFGVTNPAFDHLARTYADVAEAQKSETTRRLTA